jgi:hypothetical protein
MGTECGKRPAAQAAGRKPKAGNRSVHGHDPKAESGNRPERCSCASSSRAKADARSSQGQGGRTRRSLPVGESRPGGLDGEVQTGPATAARRRRPPRPPDAKVPWIGRRPAAAAAAARQTSAGAPTAPPTSSSEGHDTVAAAGKTAAAILRPAASARAARRRAQAQRATKNVRPRQAAPGPYGFTSGGSSPAMPAAIFSAASIARSRLPPAIFSQSLSE